MSDEEMPMYESHSDTSIAAAASMKQTAPILRAKVEAFIRNCAVTGATDDEVEVAMGLRHQTASARRVELLKREIVYDSGRRRKTRSGRNATVWVHKAHRAHDVPVLPSVAVPPGDHVADDWDDGDDGNYDE